MKFKFGKLNANWVLLLCMILSISLVAQNKGEVTGLVTDSYGNLLPGVSVLVVGSTKGVQTNFDGAFSIEVSKGDMLEFSFLGMKTQRVTIGDNLFLTIILIEEANALEEVVLIGYGSSKKKDVTGSIATIKSEDIKGSGSGTIEGAMSGRTAGVVINSSDNSPGANMSVTIRGASSLNASSAPLYVIDGFPIEGALDEGGSTESSGLSPLSGLDPNDIESMNILKDASATAIYGARGANGVVIIKTKSAKKGKLSVNFNAYAGIQKIIKEYKARNTEGFAKFQHDRYFPFDKRDEAPVPGDDNYKYWDYETYKDSVSTDWMDEVTQLGEVQSYNLSMSGGDEKSSYVASIGYYENKGIVKETDFTRVTGNFKGHADPLDWMALDFSSRFNTSDNNGTVTTNSDGAGNYAGILQQAIRTTPLKDPNEDFLSSDNDDGVTGNPLSTLKNVDMLRENFQNISNFSINLKPLDGLMIKSMVGFRKSDNDFYYFAPSTTSWGTNYNGIAKIQSRKTTSWLFENTISYYKKLGDHTINVLGGFSSQSTSKFNTDMLATNFPIETLGYNNMGVGESFSAPQSYGEEYFLQSYFTRLNYNYKSRYLLTASFRADGSSKFASNHKWGYFPSFAFAWRAENEKFIKSLNVFDQLKFRAGWGETGNPNIPPYQSLTNYGLTSYPSGSSLSTGVYPINAGNPNLKWETSVQSNIGLDISVLDYKLSLTVDAYLKTTTDLLLKGEIPPSLGFGTYLYNSGEVRNKGLEFTLNSVLVDNSAVLWTADFNISFYENEVVDLGELTTSSWITVPGTKNHSTAILEEGNSIGLWYGYQTDGLWSQEDFTWNNTSKKYELNSDGDGNSPAMIAGKEPGSWRFKDISGPEGSPDGVIDSWDKTVIGKSQPKFSGGFSSKVAYKNFDLSLFLEGSYGRDVYNANNRFFIEPANQGANSIEVDYWRPIQYELDASGSETTTILDPGNPNGKYPGAGKGDPYQDMHDAYIEDASYLRIKNITVGYTFEKVKINSLRVYANILNVHTFTNYSGYDPSVNAQSLGGLRPGYDYSSYPMSTTYMLGLSASF